MNYIINNVPSKASDRSTRSRGIGGVGLSINPLSICLLRYRWTCMLELKLEQGQRPTQDQSLDTYE